MSAAHALPYALPGDASSSVFLTAVQWAEGVLLGPIATSFAVIAVGSIGFAMLAGRLTVRRGVVVIIGCFILFGASQIAQGFRNVVAPPTSSGQAARPLYLPEPAPSGPPPYSSVTPADPYAGAAIRR